MGFYTWVDDANLTGNVQDDVTFASDSQRENGFQSGAVASSIRVNTALRQATLVTKALMESMNLGSLSFEDPVSTVKTAIENFFAGLEVIPNPTLAGTETVLTGLTIAGTKYKIQSGGGGTTVIANPVLDGTEATLVGLQVASTKYALPRIYDGTFTATCGTKTQTGHYTRVGHQLTLAFPSLTSFIDQSDTKVRLTDDSANWASWGEITKQYVTFSGANGTDVIFATFEVAKAASTNQMDFKYFRCYSINSSMALTNLDANFTYNLNYLEKPTVTFYID